MHLSLADMVFTCTFPCVSAIQTQRHFTWSSIQHHRFHFAPSLPPPRFKPCCSSRNHTYSIIQDTAVIACLRANSAEQAMEAARAALNGGIAVLEIVRSTPSVFEVLQTLVKEYPTRVFGVGTVLNAEDARNATNAGAKFLMSPATVKDIIDEVQDDEVLYIPGVMTPTEMFSAYNAGAKIVKVVHDTYQQ